MKRRLYTDQYIVITGAAGMLGSAVVHQLNLKGFSNLILVDSLNTEPKWRYLLGSGFQHLLMPEDMFGWLQAHHEQVEAVVHLASRHESEGYTPDQLLQVNYFQSIQLAELCLKHQIKLIYSSSGETYGDGSCGFGADPKQLQELKPLSMSGYSHHLFDLWCYHQNVFDEVTCCKVFELLGSNDRHKPKHKQVLRRMVHELKSDGAITLYESPCPERIATESLARDFIGVADAAELVASFLSNQATGIYNVGRGRAVTWLQLAHHVSEVLKLPLNIHWEHMPHRIAETTQLITCADLSNWADLGPVPHGQNLDDVISDAIASL